jgi:hypothetical protein
MYSTCLFCSASLGRNEAIEAFPVGNRVAFDAARGRLWAACSRCGRWNLAPIEERWEAVEQAEQLFVDTRTRVQSENIGLARLRDGTRLIRVGAALPGELAAWRYGGQLISRRNRNIAVTGAFVAGSFALVAGVPLLLSTGLPLTIFSAGTNIATVVSMRRQQLRVLHRLPAAQSPTGRELVIRRWHLNDAEMRADDTGQLMLDMPPIRFDKPVARLKGQPTPERSFRLEGPAAHGIVARMLMDYNQKGGSRQDVERAVKAITEAGGAAQFAQRATGEGVALTRPNQLRGHRTPGVIYTPRMILGTFRGEKLPVRKYVSPFQSSSLPLLSRTNALALEMALQDEAERRALEGELAGLEAAWREAEEIARIADALPDAAPAQQQE